MSKTRITIIVTGFIIAIIIISVWVNELGRVQIGNYRAGAIVGGNYYEGQWYGGDSPEEVHAKRTGISTRYGLFLLLVIGGTALAAYMFNGDQKEMESAETEIKKEPKTQESNGGELEREIAELKTRLTELEKLKDVGRG